MNHDGSQSCTLEHFLSISARNDYVCVYIYIYIYIYIHIHIYIYISLFDTFRRKVNAREGGNAIDTFQAEKDREISYRM